MTNYLKLLRQYKFLLSSGVRISASSLGNAVRIEAPENSRIKISKSHIGRNSTLIAKRKSEINLNQIELGEGCQLHSHYGITIGENTLIAEYVVIRDQDHDFRKKEGESLGEKGFTGSPIRIGKNVWIGSHVTIVKGVQIGDNAVIGAGAVVTKSVNENTVVAGVPAKPIG